MVSLVALGEKTLDRKFPSDVMMHYTADSDSVAAQFEEVVQ